MAIKVRGAKPKKKKGKKVARRGAGKKKGRTGRRGKAGKKAGSSGAG